MIFERPSTRVRQLIAAAAQQALDSADTWIAAVSTATLSTSTTAAIVADPDLRDALRRGNADNLVAWATANIRSPGEPVPANASPVQLGLVRDLVRRGLYELALDAYRSGQDAAWELWMPLCFQLTRDPDELEELLRVSATSIADFVGATINELTRLIDLERDVLSRGSESEQRELVSLILSGAPVARRTAEPVLRYGLEQQHTAAVIWSLGGDADLDVVEKVTEQLMRSVGVQTRLTVVAAHATLWTWLPTKTLPSRAALNKMVREVADVRIAFGQPAPGVKGFRRSHHEAMETRRFMNTSSSSQRIASFEDIRVAALASQEPAAAQFVSDVLGEFEHAPEELQDTLRTYLRHLGNAAKTSTTLFTHRNTTVRRIARADELLPRPHQENPLSVALALEILHWQGKTVPVSVRP